MANKKIWLGILVMALVFGFLLTGCGNSNENDDEEDEDDNETIKNAITLTADT